jgi:branched-chain amino acid transport system permease protein
MSMPSDGSALPVGSVAPRAWSRQRGVIAAVALVLGIALPQAIGSQLLMTLLTQAVISGLLATSVGMLLRMNGVVSFGHAAFYGIAGYTIALSLKHGWMGAELAILVALLLPTALAFVLGLGIVGIPGIAFSMLTLAVGQAFHEFAVKARGATGGDDGLAISLPSQIFSLPTGVFQRPGSMFVVCWIVLVLVLFGLSVLSRTQFGRLADAIRENEERARFIGYRTVVPRALVLALSAFVAALAGVLFALYNAFVSPDVLHWSLSGSALIMAIIGGPRLLWGPAFGAIIFFFFKDLAGNLTEHWPAMIGVTLIVVTVLLPMGIGGALKRRIGRARGEH